MASKSLLLVSVAWLLVFSGVARADFLIYKLGTKGQKKRARQPGMPGGQPGNSAYSGPPSGAWPGQAGGGANAGAGRQVLLYGKVGKDRAGITYAHPVVSEELIFQSNQVEIKHALTIRTEFNNHLRRAGKDPDEMLQAAVWGLKKGLVFDFYAAIDKILTLDPQHVRAQRIKELQHEIDVALPDTDDPAVEKALKSIVNRPGMRIETSRHFMLLSDTSARAEGEHRRNRGQERLHLLEQMYERFVLLFEVQGVPLELPRQRLMAVLFKDRADFREFAQALDPESADKSGFWSHAANVIGFYDESTTEESVALKRERETLEKTAEDAKKAGSSLERRHDSETLRQIKINRVLLDIDRWNCDVAAVSRAAGFLLAENTGLFPRRVEIPRWVREGLAAYVASPRDEAWAGSAAVSESRLHDYDALKKDLLHANVDFIIGDQILEYASAHHARSQGTAQVWAFTHFLFEQHAKELVAFYGLLGSMPPDVALNGDLLEELFTQAFGPDRRALAKEWNSYMHTLASDVARLEGEEGDRKSR